jgi:glycine/sarcosine N-methyltransferase
VPRPPRHWPSGEIAEALPGPRVPTTSLTAGGRALCQAAGMGDSYVDLAYDYEWLFPDEVSDSFGATSPGSQAVLAAAVQTLRPGAPVLDCACGIGSDAMVLARQGFVVTATDGSPAMAAETRLRSERHGIAMAVSHSQWQDLPQLTTGPFELVLCLGNSLVHAGSSTNRVAALEGMKKVLGPKGVLIIDSRNWELLYRSRPRIVPARKVIERRGLRCSSLYIWTIPEDFEAPCTAEIVLIFEDPETKLAHRRYVLNFNPFRHGELANDIRSAGFTIRDDSYHEDGNFYSIAATID